MPRITQEELNKYLQQIRNNEITELNLANKSIGEGGARSLAEALKKNSSLTSLNLEDNNIGEGGARSLSGALEKNQSLTSLDLRFNNIGEGGARSFSEALEKNQSLTYLNLRDNKIGEGGARSLSEALEKNQSLTSMNLRDNNIGEGGARSFSEALEKNQSLTSLNLWGNDIGYGGARSLSEALEKNQSLTYLDLRFNKIGEGGARSFSEALEKNQSLTSLYLENNNIGEKLKKEISDKVAKNCFRQKLKQIRNNEITSLNLMDNKIGEGGARSLSEALENNKSLTYLNLRDNNIGEGGARSLSEALEKNQSLTYLNLSENNIGGRLEQQIYNLISINKEISNIINGKANKLALLKVENIFTRTLSSDIIKIKNINILENLFNSGYITYSLDLSQNNPTIDEYKEFILSGIRKNKGISTMSLSGNKLVDSDIANLANSLRHNHTLYSLDLSRNNIGETGVKDLKGLLKYNCSLLEINLRDNEKTFGSITEANRKELEESLSNNKKINSKLFRSLYSMFELIKNNPKEFLFSNSYDFGAKDNYILNLLKCVGGLYLVLEKLNARIENKEFIANFYKKIAQMMNENGDIKLSSLLHRSLRIFLFDEEKNNFSLFRNNRLEAEACKNWLNKNLKSEKQIQANQMITLDLSSSNINDEQVSRFAKYLADNTSLKEFNLSHNNIGDNGAEELAKSLEVNEILERLYLSDNAITDIGASFLREVLTENETLKQLSLEDNQIGQDNIDKIDQLLACNRGDISANIFEKAEEQVSYLEGEAMAENQDEGEGDQPLSSNTTEDNSGKIEEQLAYNESDLGEDNFMEQEEFHSSEPQQEPSAQPRIDESTPQAIMLMGLDENAAASEECTEHSEQSEEDKYKQAQLESNDIAASHHKENELHDSETANETPNYYDTVIQQNQRAPNEVQDNSYRQQPGQVKNNPEEGKCNCCTVMQISEIKYDNKLIDRAMKTGDFELLKEGLRQASERQNSTQLEHSSTAKNSAELFNYPHDSEDFISGESSALSDHLHMKEIAQLENYPLNEEQPTELSLIGEDS